MKVFAFTKNVLLIAGAILFHFNIYAQALAVKSQWVYMNTANKLQYKTTERGDRIMDFSYAGYMGGGVAIPSVPVKISVSPAEGDNTNAIQQAIDQVTSMPLVNGIRGAVLLKPGTYNCERPITISASGVVLQGSGSRENGSLINMSGTPHACFIVKGNETTKATNTTTTIADQYVPSGALHFQLRNTKGFSLGDTIRISRPVTDAWVQFMGMDKMVREGNLNQLPPGAANWVIGCKGEPQKKAIPFDAAPLLPEGIYDAHNTPVAPSSLYLAQLEERLGKQAVRNVGY